MHSQSILTSAVAALALALPAAAAPQQVSRSSNKSDTELSLTTKLRLAETAGERYALLPDDKDFVFDFSKSQVPIADVQNFPALVGTGATVSHGSIDACSMIFLHLHPRASEIFTLSAGKLITEMVPEISVLDANNKQRVIRNELSSGMTTIFPQGSFHTQYNPGCEPANFTVYFNSEDVGAALVADQTFSLDDDVISRTFGQQIKGDEIDKVRKAIPGLGKIEVEECMKQCN